MGSQDNLKKSGKIFFSGSSVQYPAGGADFKPAHSREWELFKAALTGEPLHWIDGFLIFETWRNKAQNGNYRDLFRSIVSRATKQLKELDINLKMEHPSRKKDSWVLQGNFRLESNNFDAVQLAKNGRNVICEGGISEGIDLVLQSFKKWPNAKVIAEALVCLGVLPENLKENDSLSGLRKFLAKTKNEIVSALAKIITLGLEEKQGLNQELVSLAVDRWCHLLTNINNTLSLMEGAYEAKIENDNSVGEFIYIARDFCEYYRDINKNNSSFPGFMREEYKQLSIKIVNSAFVRNAADETVRYFESLDPCTNYSDKVNEFLKGAVYDFIFEFDLQAKEYLNLYPAFCRYLTNYVIKDSVQAGVEDIFTCKDEKELYKQKIINLLHNFTDIDELSKTIEGLFGDLEITQQNEHKLILQIPSFQADSSHDQTLFCYEYRGVRRVGVRNELNRLRAFMDIENQSFLWWMIIGEGGAGKSRLALELCIEYKEKGWHTGFIANLRQLDKLLDGWQPGKPTLIVIDHSSDAARLIADFFNVICMQNERLCYPVRVLLIDREEKSQSQIEFKSTNRPFFERTYYSNIQGATEPGCLTLNGISDLAAKKLIKMVFKEKKKTIGQKELNEVLHFIKSNISYNIPLYVILAADAFASTKNPRQWNKEYLLKNVLARQKEAWKEAGVNDADHNKHINLLAISTVTDGINLADLHLLLGLIKQLAIDEHLPPVSVWYSPHYKSLCGKEIKGMLPPLAPDLLGECFVLEHLRNYKGQIESLSAITWEYRSWAAVDFLTRTAQDFPSDTTIHDITHYIKCFQTHPYRQSVLFCDLVSLYCNRKEIDIAEIYFNSIEALWEKHCNDLHISVQLAKAGFCVIYDHLDVDKAILYYNWITKCLNRFTCDGLISLLLTKAGFNIIFKYETHKNLKLSMKVFDDIHNLWMQHKNDEYIATSFAKACSCLICDLGTNRDIDYAKKIFEIVYSVWQLHKMDEFISFNYVKAGLFLTKNSIKSRNKEIAMMAHQKTLESEKYSLKNQKTLSLIEELKNIDMN